MRHWFHSESDRWQRRFFYLLVILLLFGLFYRSVPRPLFQVTYSTVLESSDGQLLAARIAADGQWRFPSPDSVPRRFETCLLAFEDRHFFHHPGINPFSLIRAMSRNIRKGRIESGGSTLTMQVARLANPGKKRSYFRKAVEMVWALNLELRFSKREILRMYVSHAPFGGNVVGLEAASFRYFKRPPHQLSWAESATLAVLPNAPSLIFPGRNDTLLLRKRNRLLDLLFTLHRIDELTLQLAKAEPIPEKLYPITDHCYHLLEYSAKTKRGERIRTTLDFQLQNLVNQAVISHAKLLSANHVYNCCALVAEVRTGHVLAYTGNVPVFVDQEHGNHVDIIRSPRSSGSILKPFLYAAMTEKGIIAPNLLVADVPVRFDGFTPLNFSREYDGAVPAAEALARSLNVPAVKMLQEYGVEPFYYFLRKAGLSTLTKPAGHYGLSLILGGAESTLWDLAGMYASLGRIVTTYAEKDGFYPVTQFQPLEWQAGVSEKKGEEREAARPFMKASSAWLTLDALQNVNRPGEETGWENFAGSYHIAWKTGTSFGFRDGWAVGLTPDYVVAVWAGNGDGEGRPGLTGTSMAAPLMFEVFGFLPRGNWFKAPSDELVPMLFCHESGYFPSPACPEKDTLLVPFNIRIPQCPYHRFIHLDCEGRYTVNGKCYSVTSMLTQNWFVLPPAMEYYYKRIHPGYKPLPPPLPGCTQEEPVMEMIYPREMERLFIPRQLDGTTGEIVFEIAHRLGNSAVLYWYIDREYAGMTTFIHQMGLHPSPGWHTVTITDQEGNLLEKRFFVVDDREAGNQKTELQGSGNR